MIRAAVEEAAGYGVFVAAHAHGAEGIKLAIRAGVRSIEHGSLIDDEGIAMLVEHGTYLVADVYDGDWIAEVGGASRLAGRDDGKNARRPQAQREAVSPRRSRPGSRIAYGTDSGVYPHGRNATSSATRSASARRPLRRSARRRSAAAALHGLGDRVGSLAPGRFADLVALAADPLADVERAAPTAGGRQGRRSRSTDQAPTAGARPASSTARAEPIAMSRWPSAVRA